MSAVTINIDTSLTNVPTIDIGLQGENEATQVVFDVSELIETYGAGTASIVVQRAGDISPYMHEDTIQGEDTVTWVVSSADTEKAGNGIVQLFWIIDDQIAKSVGYQFYVTPALTDPTDAPVVPGGWISEQIGDLSDLDTEVKTDLVSAVNEIASGQASGLSAVGVTANYVPTADGSDGWDWQAQQGGGGGVTVDSALSTTSTNPVQNKEITTALNGKADSSTTYTKTEVDTALSGKAGTATATTSANGLMSSTDKGRLDDLYADYSSALTALGVI